MFAEGAGDIGIALCTWETGRLGVGEGSVRLCGLVARVLGAKDRGSGEVEREKFADAAVLEDGFCERGFRWAVGFGGRLEIETVMGRGRLATIDRVWDRIRFRWG